MGESQGGTYCENDRCIKKPKFTSAICFSGKFWGKQAMCWHQSTKSGQLQIMQGIHALVRERKQ